MERTIQHRQLFKAEKKEWAISAVYLLSLSLIGLDVWLAAPLTLLILLNRFAKNKPEFIVQLFILCTYSGFLGIEQFPFFTHLLVGISFFLILVHWCDPMVRKMSLAIVAYIVFIILLSSLNGLSIVNQLRAMIYYFSIICFVIPFITLRHETQAFERVSHTLVVYTIVICVFYILDGFIFEGFVLLPNTSLAGKEGVSKWDHLLLRPFTGRFYRKYPPGLYIMLISAFFMARDYKLKAKYWIIIILAFLACRTMTFMVGVVMVYVMGRYTARQSLKVAMVLAVMAVGLYYVDSFAGGFMRISSTTDQFLDLNEAFEQQDIERLAQFGSGRIAQAYPKWVNLEENGQLWRGYGFVHQDDISPEMMIYNDLYESEGAEDRVESLSQNVEITQVQTILDIGYLGFLVQLAVFVLLAVMLYRNHNDWKLYAAVITGASIAGLGGFVGFNTQATLWLGMALGLSLCHKTSDAAFGNREAETLTATNS